MKEFYGVQILTNPWVILPIIIIATALLALLLNYVVLWVMGRIVQKTSTEIDNRLYKLLERYLFPLLAVALLLVWIDFIPLPAKILQVATRFLIILALLLVIFLLTKGALLFLRRMEMHYEALRNIKDPIEIVTKIVFIAVGGMIILENLGISLTPIITTLGIGSLAVAIALQDTLGNFFAGLYIKADRPIKVGHYVRLESGGEGYVDHIGWRSTLIRALQNNVIIVPNSKLAQIIVTNYYLPERELAVLVEVGVNYDSNLKKVEKITREVAKQVLQKVPGAVPSFEPLIRYHTFNHSSINFSVILRGKEFVDNFLIKHEFIKSLHARFEAEGITFPMSTVYLKGEPNGRFREQGATGEH